LNAPRKYTENEFALHPGLRSGLLWGGGAYKVQRSPGPSGVDLRSTLRCEGKGNRKGQEGQRGKK